MTARGLYPNGFINAAFGLYPNGRISAALDMLQRPAEARRNANGAFYGLTGRPWGSALAGGKPRAISNAMRNSLSLASGVRNAECADKVPL